MNSLPLQFSHHLKKLQFYLWGTDSKWFYTYIYHSFSPWFKEIPVWLTKYYWCLRFYSDEHHSNFSRFKRGSNFTYDVFILNHTDEYLSNFPPTQKTTQTKASAFLFKSKGFVHMNSPTSFALKPIINTNLHLPK